MKLGLLLQLGMLFGGALPLIVPFLGMGVVSEEAVAAVAGSASVLQASSKPGVGRWKNPHRSLKFRKITSRVLKGRNCTKI